MFVFISGRVLPRKLRVLPAACTNQGVGLLVKHLVRAFRGALVETAKLLLLEVGRVAAYRTNSNSHTISLLTISAAATARASINRELTAAQWYIRICMYIFMRSVFFFLRLDDACREGGGGGRALVLEAKTVVDESTIVERVVRYAVCIIL